jgi:3-oxoacyl-[acyl-carrier protein] reductase
MQAISSLLDVRGSTALVTGGGVGLGAAIAERLAEAGADICITYASHGVEAHLLTERIHRLGRSGVALQSPEITRDGIEEFLQHVQQNLGTVNILVNNAGIFPRTPVTEMSDEEWDRVFEINLKAAALYAGAVGRARSNPMAPGRIINISSIAALVSEPGFAHYSASKAGMNLLTMNLALEMAPLGFTVNTVSPGLVDSHGDLDTAAPDLLQRFLQRVPLKRVGIPSDIANAVLFLASPAASWITGQNLVVDGGVTVAPVY